MSNKNILWTFTKILVLIMLDSCCSRGFWDIHKNIGFKNFGIVAEIYQLTITEEKKIAMKTRYQYKNASSKKSLYHRKIMPITASIFIINRLVNDQDIPLCERGSRHIWNTYISARKIIFEIKFESENFTKKLKTSCLSN